MEHVRFGRTGLRVSRLCLGTMTFGFQCDEPASVAILDAAAEAGITFLDTADAYPLGAPVADLGRTEEILGRWLGIDVPLPAGGFYLWFDVGDGWGFAERLAVEGGAVVSPGEFYGAVSSSFVRVAVVQPDERIELVAERLGV